MGRRERFIMPTEAEFRRMEEDRLAKIRHTENRKELIAKTLRSQRKDALVQVLSKLCDANIHARWIIEAELGMNKPVELVLHDLREAIQLATHVDDERVDRNFSYDWEAYAEVKRLMEMLVSLGEIGEAMEMAIHFMDRASRQISYSDEGMMLEEVEASLAPVLQAMENQDETQRSSWAMRMQKEDQVGIVCRDRLQEWSSNRNP